MLPEISARRSLLWVKFQIPVVTDRQGGRDKSAPRPFVTDPIHPPNSSYSQYQLLSLYNSVPVISSLWYVQVSIGTMFDNCTCAFAELLLEPLSKAFWRYVLLRFGARYMQFTHAHLLNKRKSCIFSCVYWILVVLKQRLQITWTKVLDIEPKWCICFGLNIQ